MEYTRTAWRPEFMLVVVVHVAFAVTDVVIIVVAVVFMTFLFGL